KSQLYSGKYSWMLDTGCLRLWNADCGLRTVDCRLRTVDCKCFSAVSSITAPKNIIFMQIKYTAMPIYMDVHIVPGVKAKDVAEAHRKDLLHQDEHHCKCMTYWIDEERENIFCLIEAPNKDAVVEMHNKAHGLVPNKVIEVRSELVESFLGRIYDTEDAKTTNDGLK